MHLDPVGSEETSGSDLGDFAAREFREGAEPTLQTREGLPKRFRMRHGRHYVDEVLGDAPLRTVREIPISELEPPPDEAADLEQLEASIKKLGVIEPLIVTRRGLEYRVIAGMRRLRAARTIGMTTVPCLVHEVDDDRIAEMREAARTRVAPHVSIPTVRTMTVPAQAAIDRDAGADGRLRALVLSELDTVERLREKTRSAAVDLLTRSPVLDRQPTTCAALVADAASAVSLEARLREIAISVEPGPADVYTTLDPARCRAALIGLLQCLLSLAPAGKARLYLRAHVTTIRPALIIEAGWNDGELRLTDESVRRFFDPEWSDHPCGAGGAQILGALARTARAHGGRVQVQADGAVTFVVPRPLSDV